MRRGIHLSRGWNEWGFVAAELSSLKRHDCFDSGFRLCLLLCVFQHSQSYVVRLAITVQPGQLPRLAFLVLEALGAAAWVSPTRRAVGQFPPVVILSVLVRTPRELGLAPRSEEMPF